MAEASYSRLHSWHHDDYQVAKDHIMRQIGDFSDSQVFGSQVLCAIYIRPARNPLNGLEYTDKQQAEDIAQGKSMLILQLGPNAFGGPDADGTYLKSMFGDYGAPKVGEWLWARSNSGEPVHISGEGAERVTYLSRQKDECNAYPFEGWPCRVLHDESFIGRVAKPHQVV